MSLVVTIVRELPVGSDAFVSRIALCDKEGGGFSLRLSHIAHESPGGDAQVPVRRTEQGFTVWLPAGFEAHGQPHQGEELTSIEEGNISELSVAAARYWRENKLMPVTLA